MTESSTSELVWLSAGDLLGLFRRRELSPVEVLDHILDRIDQVNDELGAFITVARDQARGQALAAERLYRGERDQAPLLGVPVSIKDLAPTKGLRTTRGSLLWENWVPDFDAPVVDRLRCSGAVLLGKTNTPEYGWKGDSGNRLIGPTRNPWNLERTAGGSSGGAAASVAVGLGPLAQGSDGAGSIRIPASFCGVVGFKPSFGLIPYSPPSPLPLLSHMGPISRTVTDAALFVDATAGSHVSDRFSTPWRPTTLLDGLEDGLEHLRVGWTDDLGFAAAEEDVRLVFRSALGVFPSIGCDPEPVMPGLADPFPIIDVIWAAAQAALHVGEDLERIRSFLDPGRLELVERGRRYSAAELGSCMVRLVAAAADIQRSFEGYDLILTPTVPTKPFRAGDDRPREVGGREVSYLGWTPFTYVFNVTGQPAISIPCGLTEDGLPVGLQIVGAVGADALVLRAARAYELARGLDLRPPYPPSGHEAVDRSRVNRPCRPAERA